ncbi:MAG: hypothetical protein AAF682_21580 [Planctomycetota bacterium]
MQKDLSQIGEIQSFASIPEGKYTCQISEVRPGATRDGSERWAVRLEVAVGEYAGRTAGWDGLVWSERGLPRVKYVLDRLGFDTNGWVSLEPEDLVGRCVQATFVPEERDDPVSGRRVQCLRVPYAGYQRAMELEDEAPF